MGAPVGKDIEEKIYRTFTEMASSLGYSEVHGRIIAALLVNGSSLPLQELAKRTGYSTSNISLSLDLLELIGVIKRFRKKGDRKLYVSLEGDLLGALKNAVLLKIKKKIQDSFDDFEGYKKELERLGPEERKKVGKIIDALEKELIRLEKYVDLLSKVEIPKD
ncbi:MAG: hypothetical protein DRP11_05565 [Candidatus Aenigmatarchaeota archaeon]|nr:MAG: hypothetical protein DRP11_05565 [Candidatus Aenigmarchaeota archaeon]